MTVDRDRTLDTSHAAVYLEEKQYGELVLLDDRAIAGLARDTLNTASGSPRGR